MRNYLLTMASAAVLAACSLIDSPAQAPATPVETPAPEAVAVEPAAVETESERLTTWLDAKYKEQLEFSPVTKTFLGVEDDSIFEIDDLSREAEDKQLDWLRDSVEELKTTFDYDALTEDAKISYDLWVNDLTRSEYSARFPHNQYVFDQMNGFQGFLPQFLMQFHKVTTEEQMEAYIARVGGVSRATHQLLDRAEEAAQAGVRAPKFAYEGVIDQTKKVLTGAPFDGSDEPSALLADAYSKVDNLVTQEIIDEARGEELKVAAKDALSGPFKEAFERIVSWHEAGLEELSEPKGVWSLPDGEAYYNERLAFATTTDLTADQIHEIGLQEVARLRAEMEAVRVRSGFEGDLPAYFEFARVDSSNFFPDTDEGRQGYIDGATAHIDYIKEQLPEYFGILPKADLVVKRVEAFREQDGAAQHYFPGTPDGSRPGVYYAHLSDMTAMPKNQMEVIAYHEGLPGHHMQISIAQELEGVPQFRTQAFYNAYAEGWALYSELLAKEMGGYEDDMSEFGRLTSEIFRAIRLVVDTGIHAKQWSEEEAVAYFMENSPEPEESIRSEIQRYFVMPGQATSYKIGMIKILDLREKAKAELGDQFDIRGFHDTVLGGGGVPMNVLEKRVDQWVASVKAG